MNYILFFTLFLADVISKKVAVYYKFPHLTYNKNLALGIPANNFMNYVFPVLGLFWIVWYLNKFEAKERKILMALALSGALSNYIGRFSSQGVVDFIPFFGLFTFNLADFYLNMVHVVVFYSLYKYYRQEKKEQLEVVDD